MKINILTLFFLLRGLVVFAQDHTNFQSKSFDSLLTVYKNEPKLDSLAILAHKISVDYYKNKDYKKAIFYAQIELNLGKQILGNTSYKKGLYNLARFYYSNAQFEESIKTYKTVIDSFETDATTYKSFCQIGRNYNELRDYYQAVIYYEKGISNPDILNKSSLAGHYLNYANVLKNLESKKSLKKGLSLLKKVESIYLNLNTSSRKYIDLYNNIAEYYKMDLIFDYDISKNYFEKNLLLATKTSDTFRLMRTYNNYGTLLNMVNNDSAAHYLKKGIALTQDKSQIRSKLYFNLAEYYNNKEMHIDALKTIQKSLQLIIPKIIDSSFTSVIDLKHASISNNKALAWDIITVKAKYHLDYFDASNNEFQITLALDNLKIADALLEDLRLESFENKSKLLLQDYATTTYMQAIRACFILKDYSQAYYYMEKNKAMLLLENISENQIKKQANLPDAILEKEEEYKGQISEIEIALEQSNSNKDSLQNVYYDYKINYADFIKSLEKDYPEFYAYKAPPHVLTLDEAKKNISKNALVLEYILDDEDGYLLVSSYDNSQLYKLDAIDDLQSQIKDYLNSISQPFVTTKDLETSHSLSYQLGQQLLPFMHDEDLIHGKTELIIVPDYTLQNMPFEALKRTIDPDRYLIHDFEVRYAYSLSFLEKNKSIKRKAKQAFLGVAPLSFNYDDLASLKNSEAETFDASSLFAGETLMDDVATKEAFLEAINKYKIIHLSTHADANDSISPWVAFKHDKLYLNELYNTKNQAELVVLSACKSSLGNIKKGEGVFSLARGFFYSGANSVVSTLWNVNDKSTQEIIGLFYKHLDRGNTKATALRRAKLGYINSHSHSELSPYYWSSLILVGDNAKIPTTSNYLMYILTLIVLLIFFFIIKRRNRG